MSVVQEAAVRMQVWLARARRDLKGQGLVEYSLVLSLIAVLTIASLRFLQPHIANALNSVSSSL